MIKFYTEPDRKAVDPKLFSETALHWAEKIHEKGGEVANKRSQLRKFYDEVLRLNGLAKSNPDDWENILPYVNMLIAKCAYAQGRKKVTKEFMDFLRGGIENVKEGKDLDVFANFFEAFMGFYRQFRSN